jgi:uncharacterized membrane protein YdjX (TVP38/TMEM64 family)
MVPEKNHRTPQKKQGKHVGFPEMIISGKYKILAILAILTLLGIGYYFREPIVEKTLDCYNLFSDRDRIRSFIDDFGIGAPFVFILFQISQVLLAPIPGEATGFIGGYLFGAIQGFIYSSIGLTVGSWLNFFIGRLLGDRYLKKIVPMEKLKRFDNALRHRGILVVFILFIIPGFPKDYLCLFLGFGSTLPIRVFVILSAIGRMPGTLMLSMQGASLFNRSYGLLALLAGISIFIVFLVYRFRHPVYQWIERLNRKAKSN